MPTLSPEVQYQQLKEDVDTKIVLHYLEVDSTGVFLHALGQCVRHLNPEDPERIRVEDAELDEFIRCAYNVTLPKKVITKGHKSPFSFVADLFYERVKNALGFANRNGGKTLGVAILNHLDMLFKGGVEIASAGAVLDQANKCYRYFNGFNDKKWFLDFCKHFEKKTGKKFVVKGLQSFTRFATGSTQEILTGTEKGLRGPHPNKARIDEIDLIEWPVLQTALSMANTSKGILGQNVFTSTRQLAHGSMQKLLDSSHAKGVEVYEWDIWESVERCPRRCKDDPQHGDCPIYTFCKGKAHHCEGFFPIVDFIDKVRILDRETFETEWENKRPSRQKMVYKQFDTNKHVLTPEKLEALTGLRYPSKYWYRIAGLDFGSAPGHPFVYLKLTQFPSGQWMIMHEYVGEQRLLKDHASSIRSSPFYMPGEIIYRDWDAQEGLELKQYGVRTRPAVKEVKPGIDYVGTLLAGMPPREDPVLYVWYDCYYTIFEFGAYSWNIKPDGSPDMQGNPKKDNDHCMDALRYALFSHRHSSGPKYRAYQASI
jgi:hypothetical protein